MVVRIQPPIVIYLLDNVVERPCNVVDLLTSSSIAAAKDAVGGGMDFLPCSPRVLVHKDKEKVKVKGPLLRIALATL